MRLEALSQERKDGLIKRLKILKEFLTTIEDYQTWNLEAKRRILEIKSAEGLPESFKEQIEGINVSLAFITIFQLKGAGNF